MNRETWDERCQQGIFGLVLAILVFVTLAFSGVDLWEFLVVQTLTIGVLALWAVRLWVSPKPRLLCPPIIWPVLLFTLYAIGRYLTCEVEYAGRLELLQVVVYASLFLAVLNHAYQQESILTVGMTLIFLAMAAASYAVVQYITHSTHIWWVAWSEPGRASGPFYSADHFCGYLEMILPLAIALILVGRIEPLTRILLGYCVLVILGGIAVTFSRAGWVAAAVGLLVVLLILISHRQHRKFAGLTLILLLGGAALAVAGWLSHTTTFAQRIATSENGLNLDVFVRVKIWLAASRMWLDHFWWGVGPAHFNELFNEYRPPAVQMRAGWVHCDYLHVLVDYGVAGGLLVVAALVLVVRGLVQTWPRVRRSDNDFGSGLSNRFAGFLGMLGGLVAMMVHSLVDFNMHIPADALVALTWLALLSSNLRFATERYWHKVRLPGKLGVTVLLAAGIGYLSWQTGRLGGATWWLVRAGQLPDYTQAQARAREKAFAWEPMDAANAYAIAEDYRLPALQPSPASVGLMTNALAWYQRSQQLNPHFALSYVQAGICLDELGFPSEAGASFAAADLHDPNGYFPAAYYGWHYLQQGQSAAARPWLWRSLQLQPEKNPVAHACWTAVEQDLTDLAGALP